MLFYLFSIIINIVATLLHHTMQISYIFRSTIFFFAPQDMKNILKTNLNYMKIFIFINT